MNVLAALIIGLSVAAHAHAAPTGKKPSEVTQPAKAFDPARSFQALIQRASSEKAWFRVYEVGDTKKWIKQYVSLGDVRYDVKKTDSLIAPIIGIASFTLAMRMSTQYDSEIDATNSTELPDKPIGMDYRIDATYHAGDSEWRVEQFKYTDIKLDSPMRGSTLIMTESKLLDGGRSSIGEALKRWLPKRPGA